MKKALAYILALPASVITLLVLAVATCIIMISTTSTEEFANSMDKAFDLICKPLKWIADQLCL